MTREEAINKVREMNLPKETKEILEALAPELAESEDERIRARLIEYFKGFLEGYEDCYKDGGCVKWEGLDVKSILAWLEKQKDERELGYIEGKVDGVRQTCQEIKDAMSLFEPKDLTPFEFTFRDYIDSAIRYCLSGEGYQQYIKEWSADLLNLEKQKEQKSESCDCSRDEESYTNGIHHVLMNPEAYGLIKQKPTEQLGGTFTSYDMAKTFTEGQNYVIAHPEKFGLCKSAEWSEEDEEMLNSCISSIEEAKENRYAYKETDGDTSYDHEIAWLKSLRPSWKPSEDQMEALKCAIADIARFSKRGGRQVEFENEPYYSALHSLYVQLEKL